jgi:replicative DNA helicase
VDKRKYNKKEKPGIDLSTMVYGVVPPNAKELEDAILGAIMLEKDAFDISVEILTAECFYVDAHQRIYRAMQRLQIKGQPIDILTVVDELNSVGELELVGGGYYVTRLTNTVVSSANIEKHCQIVKQKYVRREVIRLCGETIGEAYGHELDTFELVSNHENGVSELVNGVTAKTLKPIDEVLVKSIGRLEKLRNRAEEMTGIPSLLPDLDRITNGWQDSDLIILAARPSVGKTAIALQFARSAAMNHMEPVPVAFFTLEMSAEQLVNRILSAETEIRLEKIANGRMDDADMKYLYAKGIQKLANAPIFIDDCSMLTILELRAKVRRLKRIWKKLYGTDRGLIIIDYLQLMTGSKGKGNREQEISDISRGLKQLAKEIYNPIIALSQLSRAVESRKGDKTPQLSDLRESGAIEQDADMVMFIYRPEYYDINTNQEGETIVKGETHVKIAKHRNGVLDTVKLIADLSIQKFYSWGGDMPTALEAANFSAAQKWKPVGNRYEVEKGDETPF